jgi:NAD(P)-dependent dehydrogenase (short-subunit alcohol dehydrogenase family)
MTSNRLALVTGSTAGIGFAIAQRLVRDQIEVIINGRTWARVSAAMDQLRAAGVDPSRLHGVAADVGTVEGAEKIFETFPQIDILVNNYGIFEPKDFSETTDEIWNRMWDCNVMSGVRLSRHYFPGMLKRNQGRVIFISSESALQIPVDVIHYGVSKTAQIALARGLAELAAGTEVTVNSVLVGPTRSEGMGAILDQMSRRANVSEAEIERVFFESLRPTSLVKRFLRPEEIGAFVAFLASEDASGVTGAALRADGGVLKSVV